MFTGGGRRGRPGRCQPALLQRITAQFRSAGLKRLFDCDKEDWAGESGLLCLLRLPAETSLRSAGRFSLGSGAGGRAAVDRRRSGVSAVFVKNEVNTALRPSGSTGPQSRRRTGVHYTQLRRKRNQATTQ